MIDELPSFEFCLAHRVTSNARRHRIECLDRIEGWLVWVPLAERETEKFITAPDRATVLAQGKAHLDEIAGEEPGRRSAPIGAVLVPCARSYYDQRGAWVPCGGIAIVTFDDVLEIPDHVTCPAGVIGYDREPHLIQTVLTPWQASQEIKGDWRRTNTLARIADSAGFEEPAAEPKLELAWDEVLAQRRIDRERRLEEQMKTRADLVGANQEVV